MYNIRSMPATDEYREGWLRVFGSTKVFIPLDKLEMNWVKLNNFKHVPRPAVPGSFLFLSVSEESPKNTALSYSSDVESGCKGYVVAAYVKKEFLERYKMNEDHWFIPDEDVGELNTCIVGKVEVVHSYE